MNAHRGLASILLLAIALGAQTKTTKKPVTLAQAVIVEVYEHNLGKAIDMYRRIAEDGKRAEDTRTQAYLRLGKAYRRLGQKAEADANLQKAAKGTGDAAKEATLILSGEGVEDGDLVKAKVKQALAAMRLTGKPDRSDLAWIGQPAVPYVVKANKDEKADLRFLQNTATVLCQLGGPEVVKWIDETRASDDVLRKRAVIKGFRVGDKVVKAKLAEFMQDGDVTVRREVVDNSYRILTAGQLVDAIGDTDEMVRRRALSTLRNDWLRLDHAEGRFATLQRLLPILEKQDPEPPGIMHPHSMNLSAWLRGHTSNMMVAGSAPRTMVFPKTDAGRRAALRAAGLRAFRSVDIVWPRVGATEAKNVLVDEILTTARAQKPVATLLFRVLEDVLPGWNRSSIGAVLELTERGYDVNGQRLSKWVTTHGLAEDIPAVAKVLGSFDSRSGIGNVCQWMSKVGAPSEVLQQLIQFADRYYDPGSRRNQPARFRQVLDTIRSINSKESVDHIVDNLRRGREAYLSAVHSRPDSLEDRAILQRLLVVPDENEQGRKLRAYAFQGLIAMHRDPGDPALFARAYEIGMPDPGHAHNPNSASRATGEGVYRILRNARKASPDILAEIVGACMKTGNAVVFKDLAKALSVSSLQSRGMMAAVAGNMSHCPELLDANGHDVRHAMIGKILRSRWGSSEEVTLELETLRHRDPRVRRAALQRKDTPTDPRIVKALMECLKDEDQRDRGRAAARLSTTQIEVDGLIEAMTKLLEDENLNTVGEAIDFLGARAPEVLLTQSSRLLAHKSSYIRYRAARELLQRHGEKVIEGVGKAILDEDINWSSRKTLIKPFGSLMNLKVVPFLLQALKNPNLQAEAQKQLESVRFYHEQSSKWQKLIAGSGFTETTAVEALVKQASSPNKDVRLAAIASLGTVADPESLPFLVKLIADPDAAVRNAAQDAVNRINTADRKTRK